MSAARILHPTTIRNAALGLVASAVIGIALMAFCRVVMPPTAAVIIGSTLILPSGALINWFGLCLVEAVLVEEEHHGT